MLLLAEDSEHDEILFKRILRKAGVRNPVKSVRHGGEAIAYLKGEGKFADRKSYPLPGVLFLDIVMQPVDGLQVLQWLQNHGGYDEMLVVVLSGFEQGQLLREAYAKGADTFLFKPFNAADLQSVLTHFPEYWAFTESTEGTIKGLQGEARI